MSGRKKAHDTEESMPAAPAYDEAVGNELLDVLTVEARHQLAGFSGEDRQLFTELIEDAGSEIQRELLRRALAARHTAAELHAFADQIRGMTDEEVYGAVTLEELSPQGVKRSVVQRMRAEADPIYGFTSNGFSLTGDGAGAAVDALGLPLRPRASFELPPALTRAPENELESSIARGKKISARELGESADVTPSSAGMKAGSAGTPDDPINEAVKPLGHVYREFKVDSAQLSLSKAIELTIAALKRGLPVPATFGPMQGTKTRHLLFLQATPGAGGHALQLHDPSENDTVWVNESALKTSGELPLSNKTLRRWITVTLPRMK